MSAPTLAVGVATYTRHDAHTRHVIADFRARLANATDAAVLVAAGRIEHLPPRHPVTAELRALVDAELQSRHLALTTLAEVSR